MNNCVNCTVEKGVAIVVIDRPEALNALNQQVLVGLYDTMDALDKNPEVKVVILTGAGQKAFAAGADIAAMSAMDPNEAMIFSQTGHRTMDKVADMRPFVIAAVNGYALGGGCELAMACDIRVASEKARFGIPEVTLGVVPGFGGTQRLPRLVGLGRAKELLATGRQVRAEEAFRIGLVNEVTAPEDLLSRCMELAEQIAANSTGAIALGKRAMAAGAETDLSHGLELERQAFALTFASPDQAEGMAAFLGKRKAEFK